MAQESASLQNELMSVALKPESGQRDTTTAQLTNRSFEELFRQREQPRKTNKPVHIGIAAICHVEIRSPLQKNTVLVSVVSPTLSLYSRGNWIN